MPAGSLHLCMRSLLHSDSCAACGVTCQALLEVNVSGPLAAAAAAGAAGARSAEQDAQGGAVRADLGVTQLPPGDTLLAPGAWDCLARSLVL